MPRFPSKITHTNNKEDLKLKRLDRSQDAEMLELYDNDLKCFMST